MKPFAVLCLSVLMLSAGCDEIDGPYSEGTGPTGNGNDSAVRKVLVEDYTGHTCVACPDAHREAERLQNIFGEQMIVLSIHTGFFSWPTSSTGPYSYDFSCATGDELGTHFSVATLPFPKGMVNRAPYNGQLITDWGSWEGALTAQIAKPAEASIKISSTYNDANREINSTVEVELLKDLPNPASLCLYMVEDSIINYQKDGTLSIPDYVHRHVLRGSLNGTWGEDIGTQTSGANISRTITGTLQPLDAVASKSYLYAILYDSVTEEVIQAEMKKIGY